MAILPGQSARYAVLSMAKLSVMGLLPLIRAMPVSKGLVNAFMKEEDSPMSPKSSAFWVYMAVAIALVLLGGAFAGLTIAMMGQDEINLQVIEKSGEGFEKKHAAKVLRLLNRGKHWVLVTLLLGNVITNETLPIVLDRSLGGGWPAVLGSTVAIVIFGEVIPQSICVRYGLPIGAWMSPLVLVLMYILSPVAWPTAKLLDMILGEDHGTTYKKAGLKTLVTLHKSLGRDGEQLNQDEVTIISAVLDLKAKSVGSIMTPMEHVFTLSAETVLDDKTMEYILSKGFSRIPIHSPDNRNNYVGMLLVKILITYDPEDCWKVSDFALATLPETRAETSCLDIVNFFQEGKSHMVLVSEFPGENRGALGVITLEDVIEELIGEEIIDESDVYVDVHKAIRRRNLAPKSRVPKGEVITDPNDSIADGAENLIDLGEDDKEPQPAMRRTSTGDGLVTRMNGVQSEQHGLLRRNSSTVYGSDREAAQKKAPKTSLPDHLKHLGPSNLASRPRQTRYNTVKIKPGGGSLVEAASRSQENPSDTPRSNSLAGQGGSVVPPVSAGKDAKDGVLALQAEYGTINADPAPSPKNSRKGGLVTLAENGVERPASSESRPDPKRADSDDTIGSMRNGARSHTRTRGTARSGSITENIIDMGGIKKTVLETTSSSEDREDGGAQVHGDGPSDANENEGKENTKAGEGGGRKKRRRKKKGSSSKSGENEDTPLLGGGSK